MLDRDSASPSTTGSGRGFAARPAGGADQEAAATHDAFLFLMQIPNNPLIVELHVDVYCNSK